ncbi:hypothetical protein SKAU_G00142480 [Synaphobranchus kaupii]|uniref:Uncharacterized protein n=1 Tax=Synaphobranchus kaupii TaxID=118154 RepID=A0A9Q1J2A2_SYNKA|nr:hypothetical protein SKAU_G00142480 [Synaphobranchus kaupii]
MPLRCTLNALTSSRLKDSHAHASLSGLRSKEVAVTSSGPEGTRPAVTQRCVRASPGGDVEHARTHARPASPTSPSHVYLQLARKPRPSRECVGWGALRPAGASMFRGCMPHLQRVSQRCA